MTDLSKSAGQVLRAVPLGVWIALAGAGVLYLLGRRALAQLGGGEGAHGVGAAIGAGAASLVSGTVEGLATGAGGVLGSILKAPSQVVDSTVQVATSGKGLSLGSWLYDLFNDDENARQNRELERADERAWSNNLNSPISGG